MTRSSKWDQPQYFGVSISSADAHPALLAAFEQCPVKVPTYSTWDMIGVCRELILRTVEDGFEFDLVSFAIDAPSGRLVLARTWTMLEVDAAHAKRTIATTMALEVPVYPEDEEAAVALASLLNSIYNRRIRSRRPWTDEANYIYRPAGRGLQL
jgi:hypothetical protein